MAQAGLGIAAAAVGLWFLLREVKSIQLPDFSLFDVGGAGAIVGYSGEEVDRQLLERTEALQEYEAQRLSDAQRIEQERAARLLAEAEARATINGPGGMALGGTMLGTVYGTIPSGITGAWRAEAPAGADRCSVMFASGMASNAQRFYTGKYCREAQAAGFISPFSGEAI